MPPTRPKLPGGALGRFLEQALERAQLRIEDIVAFYHGNPSESGIGNHNVATITSSLANPAKAPVAFFITLADFLRLSDPGRQELALLITGCTPTPSAAPPTTPSILTSYLDFMNNRSFIENYQYNAELKQQLARHLVGPTSPIPDRSLERIYLDGGSTMMYLAEAIVDDVTTNRSASGQFVTNNFVIAHYFASHGIPSNLTGGIIDVAGESRIHGRLTPSPRVFPNGVDMEFDITTAIVSPAISVEHGPLQLSEPSRAYMKRIFDAMLPHEHAKRLIVAIDYEKMLPEVTLRSTQYGFIFHADEDWERIKRNGRFYIVVTGAPKSEDYQHVLIDRISALRSIMDYRIMHIVEN